MEREALGPSPWEGIVMGTVSAMYRSSAGAEVYAMFETNEECRNARRLDGQRPICTGKNE